VYSNGGSWNEGIRMHLAPNSWCGLVMCGSDNTGASGTSAKTWSIHNHDGDFYIANNGSSSFTNGIQCTSGTWAIMSSGNVGIGTTSPSYKLHVAGVIYSTTGIFSDGYVSALGQNTSSDIRLKDVQGDVDLSIDMLANAPSKAFVWKANKALGEQVGTIAQYWQKHLPQVVHDNNGYLAMQYDVAALLGVISVAKKVKSHEERIAELEREIEMLNQELETLKN
jgi:hypothetical protein